MTEKQRPTQKADSVLAQRIRERMEVLGLNPFSAAMKAGVGADTVRDILRGKVKHPSAERLGKLAAALECSIVYLLGRDESSPVWYDGQTGEPIPEAAPPAPLQSSSDIFAKEAVLLPIRFELMADVYRKASEVARKPLGYEAATVPAAYRGRASWWELVRDESINLIAPPGSLVQVVEMSDDERHLIEHGDLIIIQKRMLGPDTAFHIVERSARVVNYRYPDLGLWFLEYYSRNEEWPYGSDDVFRETEPTAPRKSLEEYAAAIEDPEERAAAERQNEMLRDAIKRKEKREERAREEAADQTPDGSDAVELGLPPERVREALDRINRMTADETAELVSNARKWRPKMVGRVIRVLTPVRADARFGASREF